MPHAVRRLFEAFGNGRSGNESFAAFLRRQDPAEVTRWLAPLLEVPPPDEAPEFYVDFHESSPFTTANLGVGECAGAGTDVSDDPFAETVERLTVAKVFHESGHATDTLSELRRAAFAIGRTLLEADKCRVGSDYETDCEFRARFVDRGRVSERWNQILATIEDASARREPRREGLPRLFEEIEALLTEGRARLRSPSNETPSEQPRTRERT